MDMRKLVLSPNVVKVRVGKRAGQHHIWITVYSITYPDPTGGDPPGLGAIVPTPKPQN